MRADTGGSSHTSSWKVMAGTEGTNEYRVPARSPRGRVGVRFISNGGARLRIEPASPEAAMRLAPFFRKEDGWKQYGQEGQPRFSKVFDQGEVGPEIRRAIKALGPLYSRRYNWRELRLGLGW